jgi:uncharacterized protein (TIGR00369 family)
MHRPNIEQRIRDSFDRQGLMRTLRAELVHVAPGEVHIQMPFHAGISQQHGFVHAAALTAIADSACGYAAFTLMPPGAEVLSVEFKVNFLKPAMGDAFVAIGKVRQAGRKLTVCQGEARAIRGHEERLCLVMQATMIATDTKT